MRSGRWLVVSGAFLVVGGVATACGGSTSGGESARAQLERSGSNLCAEACETVVGCDLGGESCTCATSDTGDVAPDCTCEEPTVADCAGGCVDNIEEVL